MLQTDYLLASGSVVEVIGLESVSRSHVRRTDLLVEMH